MLLGSRRHPTFTFASLTAVSGLRSAALCPASFQPIRSRLLRSVDRGTLNARHTDALLAPPSRAATICSICSSSSDRGRPPMRASTLCGRQTGVDALSDQRALELR